MDEGIPKINSPLCGIGFIYFPNFADDEYFFYYFKVSLNEQPHTPLVLIALLSI